MRLKTICAAVLLLFLVSGCGSSDSSPQVKNVLTGQSFPSTPEEVQAEAEKAIALAGQQARAIMDASPRTFENTIEAFEVLYYDGLRASTLCSALANLSPDDEIRQAARAADMRIMGTLFSLMGNDEFVDALTGFDVSRAHLAPQERLMYEKVSNILTYVGAYASPGDRQEILQLNTDIQRIEGTMYAYLASGFWNDALLLLPELTKKRATLAELAGFDSYAAYIIKNSIAKKPERAKAFLQEISEGLEGAFQGEVETLLELKKEKTGDDHARFFITDVSPYKTEYIKRKFGISDINQALFPMKQSLEAAFNVAKIVLGVNIRAAAPAGPLWSDDVTYYLAEDARTGEALGSFYLDPFTRDHKLSNPRLIILDHGKLTSENTRNLPSVIFVANFTKPRDESPCMLSYGNVRTLFHEFGHTMQYLLTRNRYLRTSRYFPMCSDSAEIHSQLFEQWLTDPTVRATISGHDDGPSELQSKCIRAHDSFPILERRWGIAMSMNDLALSHDVGKDDAVDPTAQFNKALSDYYLPYESENGSPASILYHLVSTAGNIYGYTWSEVMALDIAAEFKNSSAGLLNPELGMTLRHHLYEPDQGIGVEESLRSFLGRDWNTEAYYENFDVH